jgi:hypothetical protein
MNLAVEIAYTFICSFFILTAAYGAIKQKRELLLFGVCFFCTIPTIAEGIAYAQDNELFHLVIAMMFFAQVIVALPINLRHDYKNKDVRDLNNKIGVTVLTVNLFQGGLVLNDYIEVPHQFGYMHFAVSLIMLYSIITSKTAVSS